jgi:hypothetical protein
MHNGPPDEHDDGLVLLLSWARLPLLYHADHSAPIRFVMTDNCRTSDLVVGLVLGCITGSLAVGKQLSSAAAAWLKEYDTLGVPRCGLAAPNELANKGRTLTRQHTVDSCCRTTQRI